MQDKVNKLSASKGEVEDSYSLTQFFSSFHFLQVYSDYQLFWYQIQNVLDFASALSSDIF